MTAAPILLLGLLLQDPASLEVGQPLAQTITADSPVVNTPLLDRDYADYPTLGLPFSLKVPETGSYSIELRSVQFDAYLVLLNSEGKVLTEDDDGYHATDSRINGKFRAEAEYVVMACALHGERGEFVIELKQGKAKKFNEIEKIKLSLDFYSRRKAYMEKAGLDRTDEYASALGYLAEAKIATGDVKGIDDLYQKGLEVRIEVLGENDIWTAVLKNNYARFLKNQGRFEEALPLYQQAVEVVSAEFGNEDELTSIFTGNLGALYKEMGRLPEARKELSAALDIRVKVNGKVHPSNSTLYSNLGGLEMDDGNYAAAQRYLELAIQGQEQGLGKNHPNLGTTVNNLALVLQERGNLVEALALNQRAMEICEKNYGPTNPQMIPLVGNLGLIYEAMGEIPKAKELCERALKMAEQIYGPSHLEVAKPLLNLAYLEHFLGMNSQALQICERILDICEQELDPGNRLWGKSMELIAAIYSTQGEDGEAERVALEALAVQEKAFGRNHIQLSLSLVNLSTFVRNQGRLSDAEVYLDRGLSILEQTFGRRHKRTASAISVLARLKTEQQDFAAAHALMQEVMSIRREVLGPNHPQTASVYAQIGSIYLKQGNEPEAEVACRRHLEMVKVVYEENHPSVAASSRKLGKALALQGKHAEALPYFLDSLRSYLKILDRELPSMTEAGRIRMIEVTARPKELFDALSRLPDAECREPYELFQQWKGRATRLQAAGLRLAQADEQGEAGKLRGRIQLLAKELSQLVMLPLGQQAEDHDQQIQSRRLERLELERELNRLLGMEQVLEIPSLAEVQKGLPKGAVMVDFLVGDQVYAWLLKGEGDPKFLALGNADELRAIQQQFLQQAIIRGGKNLQLKATPWGQQLVDQLWSPIAAEIDDADVLLICPDGFLCELPFGILPTGEGGYLIEKIRFHYLADPTRPGVVKEPNANKEGPVFAVGGVNYFRRDQAPESEVVQSGIRSRMSNSWSSLPATKDELQTLRDLHEFVLEWHSPMTVLEGKSAIEERVRQELPGKRYVHIATHGYFEPDHLPSLLADAALRQQQVSFDEQIKAVGMLPGLLSGLVFAGVNDEPDPARDDGFLTAEEIQHLDLSACELVVLSACETALGSARAGEGLMSLRRAFAVAGADAVVSSLWKVDDAATAQLMKDFYSNLWERNMSRSQALHTAKLRLLQQNRAENGGDAMPNTWGAFVLSGRWN